MRPAAAPGAAPASGGPLGAAPAEASPIESTMIEWETGISIAPKTFQLMCADLDSCHADDSENKNFTSILKNVIVGGATLGKHTIEYKTIPGRQKFSSYNSKGFVDDFLRTLLALYTPTDNENGQAMPSKKTHQQVEPEKDIQFRSIGVNFEANTDKINIHVKFRDKTSRPVRYQKNDDHDWEHAHDSRAYALNIHLNKGIYGHECAEKLNQAIYVLLQGFLTKLEVNEDFDRLEVFEAKTGAIPARCEQCSRGYRIRAAGAGAGGNGGTGGGGGGDPPNDDDLSAAYRPRRAAVATAAAAGLATAAAAAAGPLSPHPGSQDAPEPYQEPHRNLYVTNFSDAMTEADIKELFEAYCKVRRVVMKGVVDRATCELKGRYCFVWTGSVDEASLAKNALHNAEINGKKMQVKFSLSRP